MLFGLHNGVFMKLSWEDSRYYDLSGSSLDLCILIFGCDATNLGFGNTSETLYHDFWRKNHKVDRTNSSPVGPSCITIASNGCT